MPQFHIPALRRLFAAGHDIYSDVVTDLATPLARAWLAREVALGHVVTFQTDATGTMQQAWRAA